MTDRVTITRHAGDPDRYITIPLRDADGDTTAPAASFTGDAPHVVTTDLATMTEAVTIGDTTWADDAYVSAYAVWRKVRVPLSSLDAGTHQLERAVIDGDNDADLRHIVVEIV